MSEAFRLPDHPIPNRLSIGDAKDTDAYEVVAVEYLGGSVWALCQCGRVFRASGSRGICDFMTKLMREHVCQLLPEKPTSTESR